MPNILNCTFSKKHVAAFFLFLLPVLLFAQTNRNDTLKAVLIVGPQEESTASSIRQIQQIDTFLRSQGIKVFTFYDEMATKENVLKALQGAHIIVYDGHGTMLGDSSKPGGFVLADQNISAADIRSRVRLGTNAVVLMQSVCMAAGSSAGDLADIGLKEAEFRVSAYAEPFIRAGAASYFAVNFIGDTYTFLTSYLKGRSPKDVFLGQAGAWSTLETLHPWDKQAGFEIGVAGNKSSGEFTLTSWVNGKKKEEKIPCFKEYNVAWVGRVHGSIAK